MLALWILDCEDNQQLAKKEKLGRGTEEALTRARTDQVVGTALVYSSSTASACVIVDGLIFLDDILLILVHLCFPY
jgi:hypothetical protein